LEFGLSGNQDPITLEFMHLNAFPAMTCEAMPTPKGR
jgi:hypothetical protein